MKTSLIVTLLLAITPSAFAAGYSIDGHWLIASPPIPGSSDHQADFVELKRAQNVRSNEECEIADSQSFLSVASFYGPETGLLSAGQLKVVEEFVEEVIETATEEVHPFKDQFQRPRPYTTDSSIRPCIRRPGGDRSYPSAHAAAGVLSALVVADLIPAQAEEFLAAGIQVGENRVLGGVHHPSDVVAGRKLAEQFYEALSSNQRFLSDFGRVKAALRSVP